MVQIASNRTILYQYSATSFV